MASEAGTKSAPVGEIPKDWIPGLVQNIKFDLPAGFIIFLIALPLCLGIAIASGFPPVAGIITGIVGGMLAALTSGLHITINGPAAGLIVIVLGAVLALGDGDVAVGFKYALAVGVVCGVIQIGMGFARMGKMTNAFPLSVVHGMLAGIGIIVMAKQIHTALGVSIGNKPMIETIALIPSSIMGLSPSVALIGAIACGLMIFWPKLGGISKIIPAPMVVICVTIPLAMVLGLDKKFLVNVPLNFMDSFAFPDWGKVHTFIFWKFVITYVFVASLESLLTAAAMDKMDPWKRRSNMDRELVGKGIANTVSSLLGGLPMIAEVVRSSANIMNGARTRWSNFFHGAFLLLFVALLPALLNMIPLAALAGMLVFIGFRLAHPKEFIHAAHVGKEELLFMVATTVVVVAVDLLWGVIFGFVVAVVVNVIRGGASNVVKSDTNVEVRGDNVTLKLRGVHGFTNFMSTRAVLDSLPKGKNLTVDYSGVTFMDHTVHERFHDFDGEYAATGGTIQTVGKSVLKPSSDGSNVSALVRA